MSIDDGALAAPRRQARPALGGSLLTELERPGRVVGALPEEDLVAAVHAVGLGRLDSPLDRGERMLHGAVATDVVTVGSDEQRLRHLTCLLQVVILLHGGSLHSSVLSLLEVVASAGSGNWPICQERCWRLRCPVVTGALSRFVREDCPGRGPRKTGDSSGSSRFFGGGRLWISTLRTFAQISDSQAVQLLARQQDPSDSGETRRISQVTGRRNLASRIPSVWLVRTSGAARATTRAARKSAKKAVVSEAR